MHCFGKLCVTKQAGHAPLTHHNTDFVGVQEALVKAQETQTAQVKLGHVQLIL